jgi:membrane fusion protein, multidrug efflux system
MKARDHSAMFRGLEVTAENSKARESHTARSAFFVGAVLLAVITMNSCNRQEKRLVLTKPIMRDTVVTHAAVCQIHSCRNIEIRAPKRGYLEVVNVQEGQRLNEGDLMFKILPQVRNGALKRTEAEARVAKADYENTERLLKTHAASDQDLATARAKWDQKLAALKLAQTHPGFTIINAPFNGLMNRLRLRNGSLVNEGDVLTTLSDNSEMWVDFNVPEAHYLEYSASMPAEEMKQVKLMMANGRMFDQPGRLSPIVAEVNKTTGTIPFRAVFPNPKHLLRHGGTGNIRMQNTIKNALLVPRQSTFELSEHHFIYVVDRDHVIRQRKISITQELEGLFVVTEGVSENDTIILEGLRQVHDGEKAENYKFEEPAVVYANFRPKAE